jgi:hypothetical protein
MAKVKNKKVWAIALPGHDAIKQKLEKHWSDAGTWQQAYQSTDPYAVPTVEWHRQGAMHALECEDGHCQIVKLDGAEPAKSKLAGWQRYLPSFVRRKDEPGEIVARTFNKLHTGTFHVATLEEGHEAPQGARIIVKLSADD